MRYKYNVPKRRILAVDLILNFQNVLVVLGLLHAKQLELNLVQCFFMYLV